MVILLEHQQGSATSIPQWINHSVSCLGSKEGKSFRFCLGEVRKLSRAPCASSGERSTQSWDPHSEATSPATAALSMLGVFSSYTGVHLLNLFFFFPMFPHIFPYFPIFPFPYSFSSHTVSPLSYKEQTNYSNKSAWQWKQINQPTVRQKFMHLFSLKETLEFPFWSQSNSLNTWKK